MKYIITYLLIFISFLSYSQNETDSLKNILSKTSNSIILANTYKELADLYKPIDKDTSVMYINRGIKKSIEIKNDSLIANLLYRKAQILDFYEKWEESKVIYYKAAKYFNKVNNLKYIGKCYNNTGITHFLNGDYNLAEKDYNIALNNSLNAIDNKNSAKIYNNLALLYKAKGNYVKAINKYIESIEIKEKINDKVGIANTYQNIGVLFWEQKNYEEAVNNYKKAVDIYKGINDSVGVGSIFINLGLIYKEKKDTASAIKYYDEAIDLLENTHYTLGLASALSNKGVIIDESGDNNTSEKYFLRSLKLSEKINYSTGILVNKVSLSRIYSLRGNYKISQKYASEAVNIAKKNHSLKYLADSYLILSMNYTDLKKYKKAYQFLNHYNLIKDSLFTLEKNKQLNEIKTKYETEKKEAKIILLEKETKIQKLNLENKNKRIRTISLILVLIITFLIISILLFLQKRRAYLLLVKQNIRSAKEDIEKEKKNKLESYSERTTENLIKKYSDSQLSNKQKKELKEDIIMLMEEEKFFLNSGFTIKDFAQKLKTNRNYISQIINEYFHTNFNNFVNEYRVKEARKLLIGEEYKNYSIEGISKTVGFRNKATFNTAFKKFTGVTPSFFQKNSTNL